MPRAASGRWPLRSIGRRRAVLLVAGEGGQGHAPVLPSADPASRRSLRCMAREGEG
jgi:hypothetical protein